MCVYRGEGGGTSALCSTTESISYALLYVLGVIFLPVLHLNLLLRILCELEVSRVINRKSFWRARIHLENLCLLSSRTLLLTFILCRPSWNMAVISLVISRLKRKKRPRDALHLSLFILHSEEITWRFFFPRGAKKDSFWLLVPPRHAGSSCFAECIWIAE